MNGARRNWILVSFLGMLAVIIALAFAQYDTLNKVTRVIDSTPCAALTALDNTASQRAEERLATQCRQYLNSLARKDIFTEEFACFIVERAGLPGHACRSDPHPQRGRSATSDAGGAGGAGASPSGDSSAAAPAPADPPAPPATPGASPPPPGPAGPTGPRGEPGPPGEPAPGVPGTLCEIAPATCDLAGDLAGGTPLGG